MHRSRNRSGRQCQYIHILFDFLDLLLVGNTKSLLLIYHQQTKVLKLYIFRQKTMCANNNIHPSGFEIFQCFLLFSLCSESRKKSNIHWIFLHTLTKSIVVLLSQNRCRHQHCALPSLLHHFESCTNGNFCLAKSHITADKSIHDLCTFHITFCCFYGIQLILRLLIRKHFFKLPLPHSVRATYISF